MDDPLPVAKGREVSTKPLLKSSGAPGLDGSTVAPGAEGYEVGAHQLIHSPELSACEKVLEPALDDISMISRCWRVGMLISPLACYQSPSHCGARRGAPQCGSGAYSPECVEVEFSVLRLEGVSGVRKAFDLRLCFIGYLGADESRP